MRPTWDQLFIKIAKEVSDRSTCMRIKVGCVLVRDNRIISMGYNGSAENAEHCEEHWKKYYQENEVNCFNFHEFSKTTQFYQLHHEWAETHEVHAEQNAIAYAAKNGISTRDSILYVTYSPCIHCAKLISQASIKEVRFLHKYDRDCEGIKFLENCNIKCTQIEGV